ncbi:uncharacterized protein LOC129805179 [Phlebotomus papatasi]|uniref:uncharacterized protein LOC129805179 n=1 Tax=Phlebotomus papatasi TaxID=29031 RepID=UPI0024837C15|nr:uncharacterized protein LOC129805179 [Phlebotomus papatasi]
MVNVLDSHRVVHKCRAVLDSGAQQSMMTENLRERLQLRRSPDNTLIIGCNNSYSKVKGRSQLLVLSSNLDDSYEFNCLVVPQVTGKLPNFLVNPLSVQIPSQITLSDPNWCVESPVDLLIGMDHYNDVVLDGVIRQGSDQPVLRQTVFGWVLSGALKDASTAPPPHSQCNMVTLASLEKTVKRFWEIEEVECAKSTSVENVEVEEHFAATFSREDSGRFIVQLPLRPNHTELGNSKKRAIRQLRSLEDRLKKLPDMRALYNESMDNYLTKGYMTEIPRRDDDSNHFYLPHHGVWKPSSSSTKLRVVFNASAKTSSGLSLNDVLKVGPTVQPDLVTVLMRFRLNPYAMKCDVSQMYLQVKLHEPHADFQRILWRNSDTEPIREYKINRVCFGVASSPYLATKVLNQLAEMEKQDFPLGSQAVTSNFYVDDGLISCSSLDTALQTQSQLGELMAHGGFTLAKWCATHPELLENVTKSSQDPKLLHLPDDDNSVEVLGIKWDPQKDVFHYSVPPDFASPIATRRTIASTIARLYDPLGLIGPVITEGKILIQMSWQKELAAGWDTELPPQIQDKWTKYVQGLHRINDIQIPRWVSEIHDPDLTELHGFADSSQAAYGAAVYVVTRGKDSSISSHLLISKSRIAPMDPLTIPKLELCAAELCAKLVARVQRDLNISKAHLWSDSTVALSWICSTREKPNLFVRKRVQSVLKLSDASQWRHVGTSDNPADLISRGCSPEALINSTLWFHGPSWLSLDPSNYPNTLSASLPLPSENEQTISVNFSAHQEDTLLSRLLDRCSRVSRLQGIVAQCIRATTPSTRRSKGPLSPQEMDSALMILIRLDQQAHFPELIESLKNESLNNKHVKNFANLQPFLDAKGLVRVGGRLERSQFGYDTKHPILLPYSRLTKLLAQREHVRQMHCGSESLLAYLRQRFWPIKGRNLTRGVTRACIHCFRVFPHLQRQLMGQLPEHRTTLDRPFSSTSVDFAGPLQLRPGRRGGAITKVWVAIFVCHSTKAIHIELVSNLSTEAFVASFRRFVARRSTPSHLFMDNATNFTGSKTELDKLFHQEVHQNSVQNKLVSLGIQFHFQPPDGPHHNGLVEAAVKSVKTHLHRVVGSCPLSYEELQTILTQVEAVLNSRPLTPISTDASDPAVLTPGHFLTGGPLTSLPDPSLQTLSMNHLSRWQLCQRLYQDFATRWQRDYIHQLQERKKWKKSEPNVRVGDLALLSKDNEPSIRWPLGEVTHVHPGPDGLVRVVDIRTATGTYRRPITRLALLPRVQFLREDVRATASSLKAATPTGISDW